MHSTQIKRPVTFPGNPREAFKNRIQKIVDDDALDFWKQEHKGSIFNSIPKIIVKLRELWKKQGDPSWPQLYECIQSWIVIVSPEPRSADDPRPTETGYQPSLDWRYRQSDSCFQLCEIIALIHKNKDYIRANTGLKKIETRIEQFHLQIILSVEQKDILQNREKSAEEKARVLTDLALTQRKEGNSTLALSHLDQAIALDPAPFSLCIRAEILFERGKVTQALKDYEISIRGNPNNPEVYMDYAIALMSLNLYQAAQQALESARNLSLSPQPEKFKLKAEKRLKRIISLQHQMEQNNSPESLDKQFRSLLEAKKITLESAWLNAVRYREVEVIKYMMKDGVLSTSTSIWNSQDENGLLSFHIAIDSQFADAFPLLMKTLDINTLNQSGYPALFYAIERDYLLGTENLLKIGANACLSVKEETPLNYAIRLNRREHAIALVTHLIRSQQGLKFYSGLAGLIHYVAMTHADYLISLLKTYISINVIYQNTTPLHRAIKAGQVNMIETLISEDGDLTVKDDFCKTPLDLAEESKDVRIIALCRNIKSQRDMTALPLMPVSKAPTPLEETLYVRLFQVERKQESLSQQMQPVISTHTQEKNIQDQITLLEKNPSTKAFYTRLQQKLNQLFNAYSLLESGLIEAKKESELLTKGIELAGEYVPIPGAKMVGGIISKLIKVHGEYKQKMDQRLFQKNIISINHLEKMTEETARLLTLRYLPQIDYLSPEGGSLLGDWAARRIIEGIREGKIDYQKPIPPQYIELVSQVKIEHKSVRAQLGYVKETISSGGKQVNYMISNKGPSSWFEDEIFTKTGIIIPVKPVMFYGSLDKSRCDFGLYGYRWGTVAEAQRLGFVLMDKPHPRILAPEESQTWDSSLNLERPEGSQIAFLG